MGRNAKRRRERRDAELAAVGGRTRHQIKRQPAPAAHPGRRLSQEEVAGALKAMALWGAVR